MKKRFVEIKLSGVTDSSLSQFLSRTGFSAGTAYEVFGMTGGKIIIMNDNGDLLEVFPRLLRVVNKQ